MTKYLVIEVPFDGDITVTPFNTIEDVDREVQAILGRIVFDFVADNMFDEMTKYFETLNEETYTDDFGVNHYEYVSYGYRDMENQIYVKEIEV